MYVYVYIYIYMYTCVYTLYVRSSYSIYLLDVLRDLSRPGGLRQTWDARLGRLIKLRANGQPGILGDASLSSSSASSSSSSSYHY